MEKAIVIYAQANHEVGLNEQIVATFTVASLLIAVSAAYLAAIWPIINDLLGEDPPGQDDDQTYRLNRRRATYAATCFALALFDALILFALFPLARQVVAGMDIGTEIDPVRASMFAAYLTLVMGTAVTAILGWKLSRHRT